MFNSTVDYILISQEERQRLSIAEIPRSFQMKYALNILDKQQFTDNIILFCTILVGILHSYFFFAFVM